MYSRCTCSRLGAEPQASSRLEVQMNRRPSSETDERGWLPYALHYQAIPGRCTREALKRPFKATLQ